MSVQTFGSPSLLQKLSINGGTVHRTSATRALSHLLNLQGVVLEHALKPKQKAQIVASLANSWATLEEKRQILTGYGRPKPVEARNTPGRKSKSKSAGMLDPGSLKDTGLEPSASTNEISPSDNTDQK